jgi:hypothetical protein
MNYLIESFNLVNLMLRIKTTNHYLLNDRKQWNNV